MLRRGKIDSYRITMPNARKILELQECTLLFLTLSKYCALAVKYSKAVVAWPYFFSPQDVTDVCIYMRFPQGI
jgi:hypothetical protein